MKNPLLLIPVLCVLAAPAEAGYEANQWAYCKADDECIVMMGVCDFTTLNRASEDLAATHYANARAKTRCVLPPSVEPKFSNCVQGLCTPAMSGKLRDVALGPETMTSWTRDKDGLTITLTKDGARELADLAKANPGKRIGLYVDGVLSATLPEPPEGASLSLKISKDKLSKTFERLDSMTVCNAAKVCSLTKATLKPIKD